MKLLDLKDLQPEHFKAFGQSDDLTPAEKAEAMRLATEALSVEELDRPEMWESATSMEELLQELRAAQKRWDELHP